ncbi:MAG: HPr family phosphocarrier protein [Deltaproteobacteria bacterium]|nr:HPr family phosphocarrier protein [Deltaproteobacteria bacterium]MBV8452025.1 HPr family phosphocarrier protein [Deltaproteobacteria bacterium]
MAAFTLSVRATALESSGFCGSPSGCSHARTFTGLLRAFIVGFVDAVETTVEIKNRLGLHLRAASTLAQALRRFSSSVTLSNGAQQVNARSVTSLMMLGAGQGTKLKARAEGSDAQEALSTLKLVFESRFGEE